MISLLARFFCKSDGKSPAQLRTAYGILCGAVGIGLNLLLFLGKFFAGTLSGSVAITADAFNNLSDAGSSVVTLLGFRIAAKAPDPGHPFGHGRAEYLSGLAVSMLILLMGVELAEESLNKILHPALVEFSWLVIGILAASICVKLYMAMYNRSLGKKLSAPALLAAAADSLGDCMSTSAVLVATLIGHYFQLPVDGWVGILVALFIFKGGIDAAKDTIDPLLGKPPTPEFVKEIEDLVMAHKEISGIHDLVVHDYGPGRVMISLHAEVPATGSVMTIHDAIDNIEQELHSVGKEMTLREKLRDEESGITLTSDKEIMEKVQQLVGLDFAQFTRTTMLSQGKFAAFLQSRGDEKADLLKKITGVEKFATIGRRIYERTAALRNEAERRHREYEEASTNTLSPEETAALISHGEEIGRKAKAIDKETASVNHATDWMKAKADSEESLRKAQAEYAATLERSRSDDFADAIKILDDRNHTGEAQRAWRRIEAAKEQIAKARRAIDNLEGDMRKNLALYADLSDRIEKEKETVAELQQQRDTHKERIGIYERGDAIIYSLRNVEQWRKAIADKETRITATNKKIDESLRPQHEKSIESVAGKKKAVAAIEECVTILEEKLKESGLDELRKEKDRQLGAIASLERVKVLADNVIKGEKSAAELRETIIGLDIKLTESETLIMGAELLMKEKTGTGALRLFTAGHEHGREDTTCIAA